MSAKTLRRRHCEAKLRTEEIRTRSWVDTSSGAREFLVDQKFKSSMMLENISRGSDEFAALDVACDHCPATRGEVICIQGKHTDQVSRELLNRK